MFLFTGNAMHAVLLVAAFFFLNRQCNARCITGGRDIIIIMIMIIMIIITIIIKNIIISIGIMISIVSIITSERHGATQAPHPAVTHHGRWHALGLSVLKPSRSACYQY